MPTQDDASLLPPLAPVSDHALHATCPPEDERQAATPHSPLTPYQPVTVNAFRPESANHASSINAPTQHPPASVSVGVAELPASVPLDSASTQHTQEEVTSPAAACRLSRGDEQANSKSTVTVAPTSPSPLPPPPRRTVSPKATYSMPQHTSSFLKHGSQFVGVQQSDHQKYKVTVDLRHVDMRESFLCGYLSIEGLTQAHEKLTTYFDAEIIGNKHTFQTRHPEWGSNMKVDMQHWNRFPAWRPLAKQAQAESFTYRDFAQREHLFMRWKEHFLVPDHRLRHIPGASFEGFYYICFNQLQGTISGIYFHAKSDKFQQLELKHVPDKGCKTAIEFA